MIDMREQPDFDLSSLEVGEHFIDWEGEEQVITFTKGNIYGYKAAPVEESE